MAEGYSKASGKVGVVLVTSGPGATNAITGIANAYMDSTPLVVITGQVPSKMIGTDAFQEVDTIGITRPCTKYNYMVRNVNELAEIVHEAFYLARSGRPGPVVIDIPKDITADQTLLADPVEVRLPGYQPGVTVDPQQIDHAVAKLLAARRPVLYVGGGIIHAGASEELFALAEKGEAPPGVDPAHQRVRAVSIVLPPDQAFKDAAMEEMKVRPGFSHARV